MMMIMVKEDDQHDDVEKVYVNAGGGDWWKCRL